MKFSGVCLLLEAELRRLFRQLCFSSQTTDDAEADDDDEDTFQGYFWGNIKAITTDTICCITKRSKAVGGRNQKKEKKEKPRRETHMGIAGIKRRLKLEQTLSVL